MQVQGGLLRRSKASLLGRCKGAALPLFKGCELLRSIPMSRFGSNLVRHLFTSCLMLGVAASSVRCGKSESKAKVSDDATASPQAVAPTDAASEESGLPLQLRKLKALRGAAPDQIQLIHDRDPGFLVPLAAAERAGSINTMLPTKLQPSGAWETLTLVSVDGSITAISNPRKTFGEARYAFRAATPGIRLVVLEVDSEVEKASYGPLQAMHVASTAEARKPATPAKEFPVVVDGVTLALAPEALMALPTVPLGRTGKPAWRLQDWLTQVSPTCTVESLTAVAEEKTLSVAPSEIVDSYLRFNRRGLWKFVLAIEGQAEKSVRDVSRLELGCTQAVTP